MDIDAWPQDAQAAGQGPVLLAVDTNVLINRLGLVQALHKRLLASDVWLFVPHVVVRGESRAQRAASGERSEAGGSHSLSSVEP